MDKLAQARVLSRLVEPENIVIERAVENFKAGFADGLKEAGGVEGFEKDRAGLVRKFLAHARPVLAGIERKRLPRLWERIAEIYARELTPEQLAEAIKFFSSPAGRKIVTHWVPNGGISEAIAGPRFAAAELTGPDFTAITTFGSNSAGKALERIDPQVDAVRDAWSEESDPESDKAYADLINWMKRASSDSSPTND